MLSAKPVSHGLAMTRSGSSGHRLSLGSRAYAVMALSVLLLLGKAASLNANGGPVTFAYDAAGRMIGVVDGAGNAAQYNYDAVGNLLSISHPAGVYIFSASPNNGPSGTGVTIYGDNFSRTPSQNTVKFGSTAATVTSSTLTTIVTSVPSGATQGITVTAPGGSYTCSSCYRGPQ